MKKRILFVGNHDSGIYNFRKELIQALLDENYIVAVATPYGNKIELLTNMGCIFFDLPINRHGKKIKEELKLIGEIKKCIKHFKPNIILSYTIKPNIYSGLIASLYKIPFIPTITGLGVPFQKKSFLRIILTKLYQIAFHKASIVFFQNSENLQFFINNRILKSNYLLVNGSGVNLKEHPYEEYPSKNIKEINLLFIGRIMKDKGIIELLGAMNLIAKTHPHVKLGLLGFYEEDGENLLNGLNSENTVYYGVTDNVHEYIKNSHAVILPSYHEGMANVLLEAAAAGRPVLASNIPGCLETFDENITGMGFNPHDEKSIANCIKKFVSLSYSEKRMFGINGNKKMQTEFNRTIIVDSYMRQIQKFIK